MATNNNSDNKKKVSPEPLPPKKRGPQRSGKTRAEIESESAERYRQKKLKAGNAQITPYVSIQTKLSLSKLKSIKKLDTIGEVIDLLVKDEMQRSGNLPDLPEAETPD